ncbi:MAG: translocation/assembly module TamB domain-containing protein [Woeseiaceae bacterium]|nr:translocation/assembly module TamB domain-containing protein [Woeseiaceae bacterium]
MTLSRKIWIGLALVALLLLGGTGWLLGSESGARWALARAASILPSQLTLDIRSGTLLGGLRFSNVEWRDASVLVAGEDVFIDLDLISLMFRYLDVDELTAARFEIVIQPGSDADDDDEGMPTVDLPIDITVHSAILRNASWQSAAFAYSADEVQLAASLFDSDLAVTRAQLQSAQLELELNGRLGLRDWYRGRVRARWAWQQSAELQLAGDLEVQGDLRRYELRHVLTAPVNVTTSGQVAFDSGSLVANLANEWQSLSWSVNERSIRADSGRLQLQGGLDAYSVELETTAQLDDWPATGIRLSGDADLQAIRISELQLVNEYGELAASGNASWQPALEYDLAFMLSDFDANRIAAAMSGSLQVDGNIDGSFGDAGMTIGLQVANLGGAINGFPVAGSGNVEIADSTLTVSDGRLRVGSNNVQFSGFAAESISLDAQLDLGSLTEILPDAAGSLRGNLSLRGNRARPDVTLDLAGDALRYERYAVATLRVDADVKQQAASSTEIDLRQLTVGAAVFDELRVVANGSLDQHRVQASMSAYQSKLNASAAGGFDGEAWSGRVTTVNIANELLGSWTSREPSLLGISRTEVTASAMCLHAPAGEGRLCVDGQYRQQGPLALDFRLQGLPVSAMPLQLPADAVLSGFVDAHLNLTSNEQGISGEAGIELRQARFAATYEGEAITVDFREARGQATISNDRIESLVSVAMADGAGAGRLQLTVQDFANRASPIDGNGEVSVTDAAIFAVFLPGISNPRGVIEGNLTISGTLGQPAFAGEVTLTEGAFAVRQTGIEVFDIDLRLSQSAPGQLQMRGSARSGDGRLNLQGDTLIGTETGLRTVLTLTGENFELARLPEWQVAASPSIRAVFDEQTTTVIGALGIPSASITINEIPQTAMSPSPDAVVHRTEGSEEFTGRRITLDVTTILGSDVNFSGFGLTAGVDGAVRLQGGTRETWTGNGTLNLRDGRYRAYGQQLEIERGLLIFNGPLDNPQLDVRAIRRTNGVTAGIQLTGTPSQLRSQIFSEPVMSDAEALSYLLTGRSLANSAGEADVLNSAAFALGVSGAGRVASQVRSSLGLETLSIEGGSEDGRIVAGKRIGDRLLVEYGYGLIDKIGTLLLRYQLTERITLESRTGTVSNLDIVYSVKKQ